MDGLAAFISTSCHSFPLRSLVTVIFLISGDSTPIPFRRHQLCPWGLVFWTWHEYSCLLKAAGWILSLDLAGGGG